MTEQNQNGRGASNAPNVGLGDAFNPAATETGSIPVLLEQGAELTPEQLEILEQLESSVQLPSSNPDGSPLTRRQRRELHTQELDRIISEWEAENGPIREYGVQAAASDAQFDEDALPATEALSLQEMLAEDPTSTVDPQDAAQPAKETAVEESAVDVDADSAASRKISFWPFGGKKESHETAEAAETEPAQTDSVEVVAVENSEVAAAADDAEIVSIEQLDDVTAAELETAAEVEAADTVEPAETAAGATAQPKSAIVGGGHSFPDIVPFEEESVFDPESDRKMSDAPETSGFDTLISRVVSDESSATITSGTSALILPSMPSGSDLVESINSTGELFASGSIDLPQALGETGAHHSLHGVDEDFDALLDIEAAGDTSSRPKSALSAVSSRHAQAMPAVEQTKADSSKKPLVFAIGTGVLILASIATVVAAFNGVFS
ncbi:hypothetical protein [Canibacter zhoujuaniae]|uniref:hypothetical protein n=1 Tax=Canibacter zhoujuaniae TaxID=2708343 RepID=UPI00142490F4|nr:hypothetical protein [Canibacter zhoujuaniae]